MKPLIRPPDPEGPDEDRRRRQYAAYALFRERLMGDTPTAPTPDWRGRLRPAGSPNPRQPLIEDFKGLREWLEPPVPPDQRQFYGPPPSDPKDRLYEHKRKGLLGLEAGPSHSDQQRPRTTGKEQ